MALRFPSRLKLFSGLLIGGLVVVAAQMVWTRWDSQANYVAVPARVNAVSEACMLVRSGTRGRGPRQIGPIDCYDAQGLQAQGYGNYRLRAVRRVGLTWVSPADGRSYHGYFIADSARYPNLRTGGDIVIRAHEREPSRARFGR